MKFSYATFIFASILFYKPITAKAIPTTNSQACSVTISSTNGSCNASCDGSAMATPQGGFSPYTYSWSSGQTTPFIAGLCAGTYTVMVADSVGCIASNTVTITEPPPISMTFTTVNNTSCACNGSITTIVNGGTPGYTYNWLPGGQTSLNISNLCAGVYMLTVTDTNACSQFMADTVRGISTLTVTPSSTQASCGTCVDGTASVIVTGGTGPYSYSWSPGTCTTASCSGLTPGTYTCCVTDSNACMSCVQATVGFTTGIGTNSNTASNEISVKISPNPFLQNLKVELGSQLKDCELIIFNALGEEMIYQKYCNGILDLNTTNLPRGIYILSVKSNQGVVLKRLVRE